MDKLQGRFESLLERLEDRLNNHDPTPSSSVEVDAVGKPIDLFGSALIGKFAIAADQVDADRVEDALNEFLNDLYGRSNDGANGSEIDDFHLVNNPIHINYNDDGPGGGQVQDLFTLSVGGGPPTIDDVRGGSGGNSVRGGWDLF